MDPRICLRDYPDPEALIHDGHIYDCVNAPVPGEPWLLRHHWYCPHCGAVGEEIMPHYFLGRVGTRTSLGTQEQIDRERRRAEEDNLS